jgi:hypothetical protein
LSWRITRPAKKSAQWEDSAAQDRVEQFTATPFQVNSLLTGICKQKQGLLPGTA